MDPLELEDFICACKKSSQDAPNPNPDDRRRRLPSFAKPINYKIILKPNLETFNVIGIECITLQIDKKTDVLVLNSMNLEITRAEWRENGSESKQSPKEIEYNEKDELLILSFQDALNEGTGFLILNFQGTLGDDMKGFYRARIKDHASGEDMYNAVTLFEPTLARKCFVCYDEPALKATFDITLVVPKNKIALTNMPVMREIEYTYSPSATNHVAISYERTPVMSTYLVAFVVGEFDFVESFTADGKVRCRVYTPVGKKDQGLFALDVCTRALPFFNQYFGIDYPISKIDLVACSDFDAGKVVSPHYFRKYCKQNKWAMENYGLMIFHETTLLLDPEITTLSNKQEIAVTVTHELSHQWFGNLVTMEWWDGLFLKEGFATFMETLATDNLFPDYDMWTQFVSSNVIEVMKMDALQSSHPIELPVNDPAEIDSIFDDISYLKGASVIRMVQNFIGETAFKKGMAIYLKRHQYKNTTSNDLWTALEEASGKPISKIMPTWTKQMGFPILRVETGQEEENRILTLTQEKFRSHSKDIRISIYESENYHWFISPTFCTENQPLKVIEGELMTGKTLTVVIPNVAENKWVKVNPGFIGYYVVHYPPAMLAQFIPAIKDKRMPPLDRLNLINDVFVIAKAGVTSTVEVFKLLEACQNEDNYAVWVCIDQIMTKLCCLLVSSTELYAQYRSYGLKLYASIGDQIGWQRQENESHANTLLRPLILSRLISLNHAETIDMCLTKFNAYINENIPIGANLKSLVFKGALSVGDQSTFDAAIQKYQEAEMSNEKEEIASSLPWSKDIGILHQVLKFSVSENLRSIESINILTPLSLVGNGVIGRDIVWKYLKDNLGSFLKRYTVKALDRILLNIAKSFVTEDEVEDLSLFLENNKMLLSEHIFHEALENTLNNHAWLQRDKVDMANFLSKYS